MADHKIASLTLHIFRADPNGWPLDPGIGSTLTSDFAVDALQIQPGEIFDARFDCKFGKAVWPPLRQVRSASPPGEVTIVGTIMFRVRR